jgi:hypothetical protein
VVHDGLPLNRTGPGRRACCEPMVKTSAHTGLPTSCQPGRTPSTPRQVC